MRRLGALALVVACTSHPAGDGWTEKKTFEFGPFAVQPQQEVLNDCIQITLGNQEDVYINSIELTTGPGFHHSNWFIVPENVFPGPHVVAAGLPATDDATSRADDGTYDCSITGDARYFDTAVAGFKGNVLFAQSTQDPDQIQQFPTGAAVKIPAHWKIVAQIHLLNPSDNVLNLSPKISLVPIPPAEVTTALAAVSLENNALGLPPNAQSSFTTDCDLMPAWSALYSAGQVASPTPNFKFYYAMAHYHALGTGMQIAALQADDTTSSMIFQTTAPIGGALGAQLDPLFDMTGFTHIRFTCDYYNTTANTVMYGNGGSEMCVFLAFTDAAYKFGGGETIVEPPQAPPTVVNNVSEFTSSCSVYSGDNSTN